MRLVKPSYLIKSIMLPGLGDGERYISDSLILIEEAGRTCYKSEDNITRDSSKKFVQKLIDLNHESVLEHSAMTVKFICDRGVSHELVRHRLASFSQESTRYCNYKDEVTFVIPSFFDTGMGIHSNSLVFEEWKSVCEHSEKAYLQLLAYGASPQQARTVLPNSLKTEVVITANFREWRHIFKLRTAPAAHPQMRELMIPLLKECKQTIPVIFDNIQCE